MRKALLALPFAVLAVASPAFAATVTVTEADLTVAGAPAPGKWTPFTRDGGAVAFGTEYGAPAGLGTGSLQISTPLNNDKASLALTPTTVLPLAELADASYWSYRAEKSTAPDVQAPALNVGVDVNGLTTPGGFTTLVFEPVYNTGQATVTEGLWQRWSSGGTDIWWSSNPIVSAPNRSTFVPLNTIIAANPDAVIVSFGANQGGGNPGLFGAVDGLTLNGTTYDFGPRVFDKADCKDGGWQTLKDSSGQAFVNQGDCVSYYASNGKTHS